MTTQQTFDRHCDALADYDVDATLADYAEDSVVVTNMGVFRGLDEIRGLFESMLFEFDASDAALEIDEAHVEDDFAYLVWHAETNETVYEFCTDTFYVPNDTIRFQTFAGKLASTA
ncbi:nuclear transport factor 2 family protein [Halocalculus aciditolerans]|uniref:SnoaL-like domain-containing protein n=1 Tax=Halocalculus aciditolerans TaxID=1383812 RepID=A0A830FKN0_9EURY|nr:nuclear transport factor 2 family protein [Halocalculus aciditolerans]GGL65279.1 hypothetical protein GCM10009039_23950 [Halocalculus aciditolerans]